MSEDRRRKVLDALYRYNDFKKFARSASKSTGGLILCRRRSSEYISAAEVEKYIETAEKTVEYFDILDPSKARFIRLLFFNREGWASVAAKVCISNGTVQNWRKEIIEAAAKVAIKVGLF